MARVSFKAGTPVLRLKENLDGASFTCSGVIFDREELYFVHQTKCNDNNDEVHSNKCTLINVLLL